MSIFKKNDAKKGAAKDETKQSFKEVWSNNFFLLKLIFTASPAFLTLIAADAARGQISIFFEHTVGIGYVLEAAEFNYPFKRVATIILLLALAISVGMIFTVFVGDYIAEKERPKVREKIKMMLYKKANSLDLSCYDNPEFYNDQVMAIAEVDRQIDRAVQFVQNTVAGITVFITTIIYVLNKDKFSLVIVVASFILTYIFNVIYNKLNFKVRVESIPFMRKRDYVKRIFYLSDYAKEIRLNPNVADILYKQFEEANDEVYKVEKKYSIRKWLISFTRRYLSNHMFGDVIYIAYLVYQATVRAALSFSSVAILFNTFGRMKEGLRIFTDVYPFATETSLYVGKIRKFMEYEPEITSKENLAPSTNPKHIELQNVSFAYGSSASGDIENKMLLKNISLDIKPGEKIALVGYNGAGKTTLVKLLMRLYDVNSGAIYADGTDIRKYDVKKYRNTIGTVFQDFQIFGGNVRENVQLDVADKSKDGEVELALADSGLMPRVASLPSGLDTELTNEFSTEGVNLSGGEAQKLAIARVFYKNAGLMILDEPSSALDPIAEYQLNHAMLEATKDKSVIFISHRLSTTRLADRIIMLENGEIVEQGKHDELLALGGKYAQMWKVQAGAYIAV